jgi:hypothetical protein
MLGRKVLVSAGFLTGIAAGVFLGARQRVQFRDQVAFITGGSRGLGLVLAREFALRGACVAISARDAEELARAEAQLRSKTDRVLVIPADMTMREEAEGAIQNAIEYFGRVDVLVNNEGTISVGLAETMTTDDYRESINTHFWGPLISMSANRAARQIIDACARGDAEIVLSIPAKLAVLAHGLFPGMTIDSLGLINRLLPPAGGIGEEARTGRESWSKKLPAWIAGLNERAARENNEIA